MAVLYLIDGHNVLYRTFFGVPRLSAPDGTPTNVVLGFSRILLKILREEKPAGIAAVFDSREPTERHRLYPEYKANRLKVPEDLLVQIPLVDEVVDALGVRRIAVPGVEADDIIGTLARRAEEGGMEVVVVSSDKDLYQIVSPRVRLKDGLKERLVGEDEVRDVFGVGPEKVVDLLALAGDPSDNVPGVPGIGEKTAAELVREFGSLDELLAHTDRLKGAKREKIEKNADTARLCRDLVRIRRDVPLREGPGDFAVQRMKTERIFEIFRKLGFRKLIEELGIEEAPPLPLGAPAAGSPEPPYRRIARAQELEGLLGEARAAALDIGDGGDSLAGISPDGRRAFVLPFPEGAGALRILSGKGIRPYVFNAKSLLKKYPELLDKQDVFLFDLQVAGYLLDPDGGTPTLSKLFARYHPSGVGAGEGREGDPRSAARAAALFRLGDAIGGKIAEEPGVSRVCAEIDMPLIPVLVRMESAGIRIDPGIFDGLSKELAEGTAAIERKVAALAGAEFNINSPKQLAFLLFEKLGLPPVKKTKTGYSTDVEVLEQLKGAHEIPRLVLEYRTLAKIRSTYVDVLPGMVDPRDGRIHTTFHQTQAATGRLSSSDPNLQNIPIRTDLGRRIREGFVAEKGWVFVGADYSQVELRLLAHLSGDPELVRRFRAGEDIHAATASRIFGLAPSELTPEHRRRAKVINFGILYGMSAFGLSRELSIGGREAKQYIEHYFESFPAVRSFLEGIKEKARSDGYVQTLLGRRRHIRDIGSQNKVLREAAERMAVNTPIQGGAADIIKLAMIRVDRELREKGMRSRLVLQVHDELVVEAPEREAEEAERLVRDAMEGTVALSVPLTVSVARGKNWGEIH